MIKNKEKINVLIPDGDVMFALSIIHCLSHFRNIKIHLLSKTKWVETRFSRHINSFTYYTNVIKDKEWIDIIKTEIVKREITVLFPVHIKNIRLLSNHRAEFDGLLKNLLLPTTASFDIANDKWYLSQFLKKKSINHPVTYNLDSITDATIENLKFPVLLKPLEKMGGHGIQKINTKNEIPNIKLKSDFILQEYIKGFDIDMNVLSEDGIILAYSIQKGYIYSKLVYKAALGVEFLDEKKLYKEVEKVIRELKWSGFAHIDLRFDGDHYKIIEINPRVWNSIEASEKVGVNFPYLYCLSSLYKHYKTPKYRFEKFADKTGLIKVIKSKISKKNTQYNFPENTSIKSNLLDPLPSLYKFTIKRLRKVLPKNNKFIQQFNYDVF